MEEISAFNSPETNLRGERYRVLVADASTCSEGVSFFGVRRVFLADVPSTPSALVQAVGRAIRMYSHAGLPVEDQTVSTYLYVAGFPSWMRSPLGAWAFRAQKRHVDPNEVASKACHLLRMLRRVGITEFEDFKNRLDAFGKKEAPADNEAFEDPSAFLQEARPTGDDLPLAALIESDRASSIGTASDVGSVATDDESIADKLAEVKAPLEASSCIKFLESIGLWEEAKLIRNSEQEGAKKGPQLGGFGRRRGKDHRGPGRLRGGKALGPTEASVPDRRTARHHLARALRALYATSSAQAAIETLNLDPLTADELALRRLSEKSREFVPALENLRQKAVDRAVLLGMSETNSEVKEEPSSDGESSACEFGLDSASSGGEEGPASRSARSAPLVLPPGWQVEQVQKGKRRQRVFVSPTGAQYRTEAQAKVAVAAARRSENMARLLKMKYSAKFAQIADRSRVQTSSTKFVGEQGTPDKVAQPPRETPAVVKAAPPAAAGGAPTKRPRAS
mmetsp:Transcript_69054/g.174450  ORF Transcript_69054/g.174450 Transcript_69054/m.174450 type:complete len:508 (+) Transcript_69054:1-1524(+)